MDERAADLDRRVAEAADAWLADPRDVGVYGRLVAAVEVRRAYLQPGLFTPSSVNDPDAGEATGTATGAAAGSGAPSFVEVRGLPVDDVEPAQDEELLDELGAGSVQPLAEQLAGDDVRAVLDRLRSPRG